MSTLDSLSKPRMRIPMTIRHRCKLILHLEKNVSMNKETGRSGRSDLAECVLRIISNDLSELAAVLIRINQLVESWERLSHPSTTEAKTTDDWTQLFMSCIQEIVDDRGLEYHVTIDHE